LAQWPAAAERARALSAGCEISDPIGGPVERYVRCADEIETALRQRLDELFQTGLITNNKS
jgi:hypothetical protein